MKASPFRRSPRVEYIPKRDRDLPVEEQTTFLLTQFDVFDNMAIASEVRESALGTESKEPEDVENAVRRINVGHYCKAVLQRGLKGWRNFKFEDGTEAVFATNRDGTVTDECLDMLGDLVMELFTELVAMNRVDTAKVGKP